MARAPREALAAAWATPARRDMTFLERLAGAQWVDRILSSGAAPADCFGLAVALGGGRGAAAGAEGRAWKRAWDVGLAAVPRRADAGGEGWGEQPIRAQAELKLEAVVVGPGVKAPAGAQRLLELCMAWGPGDHQ